MMKVQLFFDSGEELTMEVDADSPFHGCDTWSVFANPNNDSCFTVFGSEDDDEDDNDHADSCFCHDCTGGREDGNIEYSRNT